MGGVGDDDIGGGDGAEHLFLHQAASHLAHGHFGFGVTLGLALFFGDLVAGHHEVVLSFAKLVGVVDGGDGTEAEDDATEEGGGGIEDKNAEMVGLDGGVEDGVVDDALDAAPGGVADDEEFEEIGGEFDRALGGEDVIWKRLWRPPARRPAPAQARAMGRMRESIVLAAIWVQSLMASGLMV